MAFVDACLLIIIGGCSALIWVRVTRYSSAFLIAIAVLFAVFMHYMHRKATGRWCCCRIEQQTVARVRLPAALAVAPAPPVGAELAAVTV